MADMTYLKRRLRLRAKRAGDAVIGALALGLIKLVRLADPDTMADFAGWVVRSIGPWLKEHRIGRDNLVAAFPEKSAAEIDTILHGAWDNLGRMGAEFVHLDRLVDFDPKNPTKHGRIEVPRETIERFDFLAADGRPALYFASHLANWELPAVCAARYKMDTAILYRRPNIPSIDRWLRETRGASMGRLIPTDLSAPMRISEALEGGAHVGMLVDQYFVRGVEVTFFGRRTMANPLLARLAKHFNCPIHGSRIVRLPGHRFRAELTEEIAPVRDDSGEVDIAGTTQRIISVIEGWIREHPEQWLWLHRRWRPEDMKPEKAPA